MAYSNAKYSQEYDNGEVLCWPCVVEDGRITEFHAQSAGTSFSMLPDWACLLDEWVDYEGERITACKDVEYEDLVDQFGEDGAAIELGGEFILFDDEEIPDSSDMF